jgi:hypothetical protein
MEKSQQNNKSRIPRKSKLPVSLDQKKTNLATPIASLFPAPDTKGISEQRKLRRIATMASASNSDPQTKISKVDREISALSKPPSKERKPATISTATKTPNVTRKLAASRTVKGNVEARRTSSATKSVIKSTMTAQEKTKRFIKMPASILRREDLMMTDMNDEGQQKKLAVSAPATKRKNKDAQIGRNVRRREALTTDKLNNLRGQNAHLKADLSAAQTTKIVAIADRTSLEAEKERLKREHNIKFGEVCQLEHVLACEQSKVANLLDQIAKQRSDYWLMAQEKDSLLKNRAELEEKNNEADKELDELAKVFAVNGAELKEVTARLDEKLHINADLKSSVNQLRARLGNFQ